MWNIVVQTWLAVLALVALTFAAYCLCVTLRQHFARRRALREAAEMAGLRELMNRYHVCLQDHPGQYTQAELAIFRQRLAACCKRLDDYLRRPKKHELLGVSPVPLEEVRS